MTFKKLEKLFKASYPNGIIWKNKNVISICFTSDGYAYDYKNYTLFDLALKLNLISIDEHKEIKIKMGYVNI